MFYVCSKVHISHLLYSIAEKRQSFNFTSRSTVFKDVPPTELQCWKFWKSNQSAKDYCLNKYIVLMFQGCVNQPANYVFRQIFGPASISRAMAETQS